MPDRAKLRRVAGWTLFAAWGLLFLAGALGELFQIEPLREFADLKRIFLR